MCLMGKNWNLNEKIIILVLVYPFLLNNHTDQRLFYQIKSILQKINDYIKKMKYKQEHIRTGQE